MLIKITECCSNGCKHCMNNNIKCERHMSIDTFVDTLKFCKKYDDNIFGNMICGGEPSEHPDFEKFIDIYYQMYNPNFCLLSVLTNGHWILEDYDLFERLTSKYRMLMFQVTYDERYYPRKLDITDKRLQSKRIEIVTEVRNIYRQGRAITNNLPMGEACKGPKCANIRLMLKQRPNFNLSKLLFEMRYGINRHCTPAIHYNGGIGLGESDLCPTPCNIYSSEEDILNSILNCKCTNCKEAWDLLPEGCKSLMLV